MNYYQELDILLFIKVGNHRTCKISTNKALRNGELGKVKSVAFTVYEIKLGLAFLRVFQILRISIIPQHSVVYRGNCLLTAVDCC